MYIGSDIQISAEIGKRLIGLIGKRVALPVMPMPGEGLADLVFRASCLNGYAVCGTKIVSHSSRASRLNLDELSDKLGTAHGASDLLGIVNLVVAARHSFPSLDSHGSKVSFFGSILSPRSLIMGRRVAPLALRSSLTSKAMWHLRSLSFDPHSHERLLDSCPECRQELDFRYCLGVHRCRHCGPNVDLRHYPQVIEEFSDPEAVRWFTALIDPERGREKIGIHEDLISENPGDIFSLGVIIAELITMHGKGTGQTKRGFAIPPKNIEIAGRALMTWPDGVVEIMERYDSASVPRGKFGMPYDGKLLKRTCFTMSPTLSKSLRELQQTYKDAKQVENHGGAENTLEAARYVKAYRNATTRTGLSPLVLFNCFLSGFFGNVDGNATITGEEFEHWVGRLRSDVFPVVESSEQMPLQNFVKAAYQGIGDPWPFVLKAIVDQALPLVRGARDKSRICDLEISELRPWTDFMLGIRGANRNFLIVRQRDAEFHLNVGRSKVSRCFRKTFTFQDVQDFDRVHLKIAELRDRLILRGERYSQDHIVSLLDKGGIPGRAYSLGSPWRSRSASEAYFHL